MNPVTFVSIALLIIVALLLSAAAFILRDRTLWAGMRWRKFVFLLAPIVGVIIAFAAWNVIPFAPGLYLIIWWTVLFAILPLGTTTYAEAGLEVTDGGDPGAPVDPKLGRKAFTTTWVSLIVFGVGCAIWHFHLIHLPA